VGREWWEKRVSLQNAENINRQVKERPGIYGRETKKAIKCPHRGENDEF